MKEFIFRRNIERYRQKLAAETDEARRPVISKLLAEEEVKPAEYVGNQAAKAE